MYVFEVSLFVCFQNRESYMQRNYASLFSWTNVRKGRARYVFVFNVKYDCNC